jgi:hypothetical protein
LHRSNKRAGRLITGGLLYLFRVIIEAKHIIALLDTAS